MRGVELVDVEISGELQNVVVNGVDIAPLVDAELNRRMPERAKMRPDDSDGFREAWTVLEGLWEGTVARARTFPEAALHCSVDDEWSFIQTCGISTSPALPGWAGWSSGTPRRGISWTCRRTRRPVGRYPVGSRGTTLTR